MKKVHVLFVLFLLMLVITCGCSKKKEVSYFSSGNSEAVSVLISDRDDVLPDIEVVEAPLGVDKATAQSEGGLYILLENGSYWPLQRAEKTANGYDEDDNFVMTSIYTEDIPVLHDGDKLVMFSEDGISEIVVFSVLDDGYTLPLNFESYPNYGYEEQDVSVFEFTGLFIVDEALDTQARALYAAGYPERHGGEIEIENYGYENFFNDRVIDSNIFCSQPTDWAGGDGCWLRGMLFADMEKEEEVTISFYQGTQYVEHTMTADLHYFAYDGCEKNGEYSGEYPEIILTKEGYAEVDISTLSNGYYVLRQSGMLFTPYYVFEVDR